MNQKMLKKFLVGLLAFNIFTTSVLATQSSNNFSTYAEEEKFNIMLFVGTESGVTEGDYEFEILGKNGFSENVRSVKNMINVALPKGEYTVKLKENSKYTMTDANLVVIGEMHCTVNGNPMPQLVLSEKKEDLKEIQVTLMLTTQKGNNKDFVMGNYKFEIYNKETGKLVTTATSDKSMLQLSLPNGIYTVKLKTNKDYTMKDVRLDVYEDDDDSYTIDGKKSMELDLVKITSESEKPVVPETKGSKEVLVRVLFDGKPKADFKISLSKFDQIPGHIPMPGIIKQGSTNEKGEVKFSGFKSNAKYELRTRSTDKMMTFETEVFEFTTNEKGMITKINDKEVNGVKDAVVEFRGYNKDSEKFDTFPVEFYAKYKDGTPAKGVEFSINRLSPRLSSYRKAKTDENGKVVFMLEGEAPKDASFGRLYNITISKMEMFKHKSVPFGMDFNVDDKGNIKVISVEREIDDKETDTSNPEKYNKTFTLEKVDRTQIYNDFKAIYKKAVEYLKNTKFENSKDADKAKKDLENIIYASKIELEETIPEYAFKKIEELNTAMDNLKKFEIKDEEQGQPGQPGEQPGQQPGEQPGQQNKPQEPDNQNNPSESNQPNKKVNKIVNVEEKVTVESKGLNSKLKLMVNRLDKNTVDALKDKNADLFDIFFTLGKDAEKMPKQDYKVTMAKRAGETVKNVYYVSENGELKSLEFTQTENTVIFATTHFSKYAVVYENKKDIEVKKEEKKAPEQKEDKKSKLAKTSISSISLAVPTLLLGAMAIINKKRNN